MLQGYEYGMGAFVSCLDRVPVRMAVNCFAFCLRVYFASMLFFDSAPSPFQLFVSWPYDQSCRYRLLCTIIVSMKLPPIFCCPIWLLQYHKGS